MAVRNTVSIVSLEWCTGVWNEDSNTNSDMHIIEEISMRNRKEVCLEELGSHPIA
jgi:hypothetical protein